MSTLIFVAQDDLAGLRESVRSILRDRGLTLTRVARDVGVQPSTLSRLLNSDGARPSRAPSHDLISRLEAYFGVPLTPRPSSSPGLDDFLATHRAALGIRPEEELALRRVGYPPGRLIGSEYWTAVLLAIRTTRPER